MKIRWRNILVVLGIFLAVVLLVDFNRRLEEMNRLTAQLKAVSAEATEVIQTQTALAGQVAYATSIGALEEWAYENMMVRPGEHPVVIVPDNAATPTFQPPPASQDNAMPNWRLWKELFFGARP
jgi:hypothetical protein